MEQRQNSTGEMPSRLTRESVIRDYRTAFVSRQASLLGRREVFTGKAKFGIFGDGKEVPQVALAHAFRKGDFRSGYYRDQTLMLALGMLSIEQFFSRWLDSLPAAQGHVKTFGHQPLTKTFNGLRTTQKRFGNLPVGPVRSICVRLEQDLSPSNLLRRTL